jgi:hypothetical protein
MSTVQQIATTIHDTVDEVTTAVEDIHRTIAEFPLNALESVAPGEEPLKGIRTAHARTLGAAYDLVRRINDRVGELITRVLSG